MDVGDARCDVLLLPIDIPVGYGFQRARSTEGTFSFGVDLGGISYRRLGWTVLETRWLLSSPRAGVSLDIFVGTYPRYRLPLDEARHHHVDIGVAVGAGTFARDAEGRDSRAGPVFAPGVRYTYLSVFGLELQGFVAAYDAGVPAGGMILSFVGAPLLLLMPLALASK